MEYIADDKYTNIVCFGKLLGDQEAEMAEDSFSDLKSSGNSSKNQCCGEEIILALVR
jgi:hypothetical protein